MTQNSDSGIPRRQCGAAPGQFRLAGVRRRAARLRARVRPEEGTTPGALEQELRDAAQAMGRIRWGSFRAWSARGACVMLLLGAFAANTRVDNHGGNLPPEEVLRPQIRARAWNLALAGTGLCAALGVVVGFVSAHLYRDERAARLRRRLLALTPEEREELLLAMHRVGGDSRRMVEPWVREFGLPGEVSPASAPPRGDEPSPTDEAHR